MKIFLSCFLYWMVSVLCSHVGFRTVEAKECESMVDRQLGESSATTALGTELVWRSFYDNSSGDYQNSINPMVNFALRTNVAEDVLFNFNMGVKYKAEQENLKKSLAKKEEETSATHGKGRGIKMWDTQLKLGFRALNFSGKTAGGDLWDLGLLTFSLNEKLLLDERALGISYKMSVPYGQVHLFSGAMYNLFAREGNGCISQNTFVVSESTENANNLFAGAFFYWNGSPSPSSTLTMESAAAAPDEFLPVDAAQTEEKPAFWGAGVYAESTEQLDEEKFYFDVFHRWSLGSLVDYSTEVAVEQLANASSLGYFLKFFKTLTTNNHQIIRPQIGISSFNRLTGEKEFKSNNSNLFFGEVMQFMTSGKDIIFYGFSYVINDFWSFSLNQIGHYAKAQEREIDTDLQYYYRKNLFFKLSYNYVSNSPFIKRDFSQYGLEARWFF